ncbi:MAG TPA: DNA gyrase subunit A [Candidatus Cloacimonadota bacterium]|nr:DNA gyrase subunit A [Candidatus Cloacimonadota bacterium]HQL14143.1 DNA gyrase subunit A [Candidatus Cloacimonadota bacterium]
MTDTKMKIIPVEIEDQLKQAYLDYSMSVIVARALPDIRDGLKPSQRRIIYAMHELNLTPGGHFRKCAKIAGDTSGNYHPHGEQVVYPTLVRLAQPWNMRYPLIDGQGNFGSIDGDPPAAMRYTEARLQKITMEMLDELGKDTVNFKSNYDETRKEPEVFPSRIPNLLVNGSSGIAVGMATNMPPHNIGEVCDAVVALIDNPDLQVSDLMQYIKGPDFPTGGFIMGREGIENYFTTGRGLITVQGKAEIEINDNEQESIVITEIPYQLNKNLLIERIVELVKEKRIDGISDIRDESGREGMRLVIVVKRSAVAEKVLNQLYQYSQLRTTYGVINLCLVDGTPQVVTMIELLNNFIEFRHDIVLRRTLFELKNAQDRLHILEGLRIALENLDDVILTIRNAPNPQIANEQLQQKFALSEIQAKAILEMRLQRLTGLERQKIEDEYNELVITIKKLKEIAERRDLRIAIVKQETLDLRTKFADQRRTVITNATGSFAMEDLIPNESVIVTITHEGYIKRMPLSAYKVQGRGGKGLSGTNLKEGDFIQNIFVTTNHSYILFFTNLGRCYWLKVYEIPEAGRQAKGKAIVNLVNFMEGEKIKAFVTVNSFMEPNYIVMCTRNGLIKKTALKAFSKPRAMGIWAIKLQDNDELIDAHIVQNGDDIILATHNGFCNRFNEKDAREMGRHTQGVRGIRLREGDYVISMTVVHNDEGTILAVSENGYGKRTDVSAYKVTKRGSKGVITLKTTDRNGFLAALMKVQDEDELVIVTKNGMIIRQKVGNIKTISRNTQGVRLINLSENDRVNDITKIEPEPDEEAIDKEAERLTQTTQAASEWEADVSSLEEELNNEEEENEQEEINGLDDDSEE